MASPTSPPSIRNCELAADPTAARYQQINLEVEASFLTQIPLLHYIWHEDNESGIDHTRSEPGKELEAILCVVDMVRSADAR